jgi:Na+-driven multidrug efflux pump
MKVLIYSNLAIEDHSEITYFSTIGFRFRILLTNLAYFLCQNSIPTLMIFFINKKQKNEEAIIAIGASNMIYNITLSPFILGLASVIEILGSQSFSSKKFYLFGCYLNRARIIGYLIFILLGTLMFTFSNNFYNLMGYSFNTRNILNHIMVMRFCNSFLELEYNIMLRYLQIIGKGIMGFIFVLLGFSCFLFYCYYFIIYLDLNGYGIGLTFIGLTSSTLIPIWIYVLCKNPNPESIFFFDKHSFQGLLQIKKIGLFLSFIVILDFANTELMSFFANFYEKPIYVSFIIAMSIYYFFNSFYLSYNILTCVCVSYYVGKNDVESARKIISYICIDATFIGIMLFILTFPLRQIFVKQLTTNPLVIERASSLLIFFNLVNLIENYMGILFSALKGLKRIILVILLYIALNIFNVLLLLLFKYYTQVGIHSLPISNNITNIISIIVYGIGLKVIDWKEEFTINKKELEEDESMVVENNVDEKKKE